MEDPVCHVGLFLISAFIADNQVRVDFSDLGKNELERRRRQQERMTCGSEVTYVWHVSQHDMINMTNVSVDMTGGPRRGVILIIMMNLRAWNGSLGPDSLSCRAPNESLNMYILCNPQARQGLET